MIKFILLSLIFIYSTTSHAQNKKKPQLIIVNVSDLPKPYSFSPNTKIEVQSVTNEPLAVRKVTINRGTCLVLPDDKITSLPTYGSRANYLMAGCYARNITEIVVHLNDNRAVTFN